MTQYIDRVGWLEKRLEATGKVFKDTESIRNMLRSFPAQYSMRRDLIHELGTHHPEAAAMIFAKEAELL